jgi:NADPH2:quinone reductase
MIAILVREFGPPEVMRLEDLPDPKPGPSEVLVRVRAIGLNPVDAYVRAGTYARLPALPYVPGSDAAGEIEAVGSDVTGFSPGDRVYFNGTIGGLTVGAYAERAVCTTAQVHRLPARVSFAQGAAIGVPYATAYRALFHRARTLPGDTVLVHGATGGVGLAAVQLARAHGMTVIGTGGTDRGLEIVREEGADFVFNHRSADYADAIMRATGGRGVDVVIEMAAHVNLERDLTLLARHGRVVVVGNRGRIEIDPRQAMSRDAAILGMTLFNVTPPEFVEIHAALVAGLENGSLHPVVARELALGDAPSAHQLVMEPGALGKIVLVP